MRVIMLIGLIPTLFITSECSKAFFKTSSIPQIIHEPKVFFNIASYLENPYETLSAVDHSFRTKVRSIRSGTFISDRFSLKEAEEEFTDLDQDAKFFLSISRRGYYKKCVEVLLNEKNNLSISDKARKFLLLGFGRFIIRGEHGNIPENSIVFHRDLVITSLMKFNLFSVVYELFNSCKRFRVPVNYADQMNLLKLLKSFPKLSVNLLRRFKQPHLPAILNHLLQSVTSKTSMQISMEIIEKLFITIDTEHLILKIVIDSFEKFIYESFLLQIDRSYERNVAFIHWIVKRNSAFFAKRIAFIINLNVIRFKSALSISQMFQFDHNLIKQYPNKLELILAASLNTGSLINFMTVWKHCPPQNIQISPQFKFILRAQPHIFNSLDSKILIALHAYNFPDLFESFNQICGSNSVLKASNESINNKLAVIDAAVPCIEAFDLIQFASNDFATLMGVFRKVCCDFYNLAPGKRESFFSNLFAHLKQIIPNRHKEYSELIPLSDDFFLEFIEANGFEELRSIEEFNCYWKLNSTVLIQLCKPERETIYKSLFDNRVGVMDKITVNWFELAQNASIDDWINKLFPLFDLDYQAQFTWSTTQQFLPVTREQTAELDAFIYGYVPVHVHLSKLNPCRFLPHLVLRSTFCSLTPIPLARIWPRVSFHSFVIIAPDSLLKSSLNRQALLSKWLIRLPTDRDFNIKICRVFLDEDLEMKLVISSLQVAKSVFLEVFPFINQFKSFIKADIKAEFNWDLIITGMNVQEFKELTHILSHQSVTNAFENNPELRALRPDLFELLYDFDFYCNI